MKTERHRIMAESTLYQYADAVRLHNEGKHAEAVKRMSQAVGSETPLHPVDYNMDRLTHVDRPELSEGLLRLMTIEDKKRRRRKG